MSQLTDELSRLHADILASDEATRYHFQPRLAKLIEALEGVGARVPPRIRNLNEDLISDAMEAQFDNIPV